MAKKVSQKKYSFRFEFDIISKKKQKVDTGIMSVESSDEDEALSIAISNLKKELPQDCTGRYTGKFTKQLVEDEAEKEKSDKETKV